MRGRQRCDLCKMVPWLSWHNSLTVAPYRCGDWLRHYVTLMMDCEARGVLDRHGKLASPRAMQVLPKERPVQHQQSLPTPPVGAQRRCCLKNARPEVGPRRLYGACSNPRWETCVVPSCCRFSIQRFTAN